MCNCKHKSGHIAGPNKPKSFNPKNQIIHDSGVTQTNGEQKKI